jgi:hypothetical protein
VGSGVALAALKLRMGVADPRFETDLEFDREVKGSIEIVVFDRVWPRTMEDVWCWTVEHRAAEKKDEEATYKITGVLHKQSV